MTFDYVAWRRVNTFLPFVIVFGAAWYFQRKIGQRCKQKVSPRYVNVLMCASSYFFLILFTTSCILFVILEEFYSVQCPIDPVRYQNTLQIFTMTLCEFRNNFVYSSPLFVSSLGSRFGYYDDKTSKST